MNPPGVSGDFQLYGTHTDVSDELTELGKSVSASSGAVPAALAGSPRLVEAVRHRLREFLAAIPQSQ